MVLDALDQRVELGAFRGIVERRRVEQVTRQHRAQTVPCRHIEAFHRRPGQVESLRGDAGEVFIGGRRRAPKSDEKLILCPTRCCGRQFCKS